MNTSLSSVGLACPYPGLRAFFTDERDWYFGRESHIDAMLTRLEGQRFLAVVGASGSGKSSLVFAGLIPALREGLLAGARSSNDGPAPWNVITFKPGDDPLQNLQEAIVKEARDKETPHLAGFVGAALAATDSGLIEALKIAGLVSEDRETLLYADQFEELFRFGETASRESREKALQFAKMFITAAQEEKIRLHVLLSMRSEFIGACDVYAGLPELISRSQYLTPRMTRKQMQQSFSCPAEAAGTKVSPETLCAILNDSGTHPDQLPLAQHVLRRMWMRVAREGRNELTLKDYQDEGGFGKSVEHHGQQILKGLPAPEGEEVARRLFMALCEQREEGPLVRRLSSLSEVEGIVGPERAPLVEQVIRAFGGDDPGFIREEDGALDVRHEAILRQWGKIADWRKREAAAEETLHFLSKDADRYFEKADPTILWQGYRLNVLREWEAQERPTEAWAKRHNVSNWDRCHAFMVLSQMEEDNARKEAAEAINTRKRYEKAGLIGLGTVVLAILIAGIASYVAYRRAYAAEEDLETAKIQLEGDSALFKKTFESQQGTIAALEEANRGLTKARDDAQQRAVDATLENKKKDAEITRLEGLVESNTASVPIIGFAPPPPVLSPLLLQNEVELKLQLADAQQEEQAETLRAELQKAGFLAVAIAQPVPRPPQLPEPPSHAKDAVAVAKSIAARVFDDEAEGQVVFSFLEPQPAPGAAFLMPGRPPVMTLWFPPSLAQRLTEKVRSGTLTPEEAAVQMAKVGQPAVGSLLSALANATDANRLNLQRLTALSLKHMQQPIFLNAEQADSVVTLMAAPDNSTRENVTEFLMGLWDGASIRLVFAEVQFLLNDNLAAVASNPARKSDDAVLNAATLVSTWARTLNSSIRAPAGSGVKQMREAALAAAKDLRKRLGANRQKWGTTIATLDELIEKVAPTAPIELRLENRRVTPLPAPYSSLAVYLGNFSSGDKNVRIWVCPALGQREDHLNENDFTKHNGKSAAGPFNLALNSPISVRYAGKRFTVLLKQIHASSIWKDFATLTFTPE